MKKYRNIQQKTRNDMQVVERDKDCVGQSGGDEGGWRPRSAAVRDNRTGKRTFGYILEEEDEKKHTCCADGHVGHPSREPCDWPNYRRVVNKLDCAQFVTDFLFSYQRGIFFLLLPQW